MSDRGVHTTAARPSNGDLAELFAGEQVRAPRPAWRAVPYVLRTDEAESGTKALIARAVSRRGRRRASALGSHGKGGRCSTDRRAPSSGSARWFRGGGANRALDRLRSALSPETGCSRSPPYRKLLGTVGYARYQVRRTLASAIHRGDCRPGSWIGRGPRPVVASRVARETRSRVIMFGMLTARGLGVTYLGQAHAFDTSEQGRAAVSRRRRDCRGEHAIPPTRRSDAARPGRCRRRRDQPRSFRAWTPCWRRPGRDARAINADLRCCANPTKARGLCKAAVLSNMSARGEEWSYCIDRWRPRVIGC